MSSLLKQQARPRRSCLYMPGSNQRALEKAATLPADVLILDLEDAVAPDAKADARANIVAKLAEKPYGQREVIVRINALATEWGSDDLAAIVPAGADGVLVPKVNTAQDILDIDANLTALGADQTLQLWVMMETPLSILHAEEIARCARTTRLSALIVGTNDLALEIGSQMTPGREAFQWALQKVVTAAKAHGITALDGVYNDFSDLEGLSAEALQGLVLGYDGKTLIHPTQIAVANQTFMPSEAALASAQAIVEAFAVPENSGKGVIKVNGKMVERLHLVQAEAAIAK